MRIVITGASSGIGEALARHYASQGATLGLMARRPAAIGAFTGKSYQDDVTDARATAAAAESFTTHSGPADLVSANAGTSAARLTPARTGRARRTNSRRH